MSLSPVVSVGDGYLGVIASLRGVLEGRAPYASTIFIRGHGFVKVLCGEARIYGKIVREEESEEIGVGVSEPFVPIEACGAPFEPSEAVSRLESAARSVVALPRHGWVMSVAERMREFADRLGVSLTLSLVHMEGFVVSFVDSSSGLLGVEGEERHVHALGGGWASGEVGLGGSVPWTLYPKEWRRVMTQVFKSDGVCRVVVCGGRSTGKSTLIRTAVRWAGGDRVALLDVDPGQPEYGPPGCVSLRVLGRSGVVGEGVSGCCLGVEWCRSIPVGLVSPADDPGLVLAGTAELMREYFELFPDVTLFVNLCGWIRGTGLEIAQVVTKIVAATHIWTLQNDEDLATIPSILPAKEGAPSIGTHEGEALAEACGLLISASPTPVLERLPTVAQLGPEISSFFVHASSAPPQTTGTDDEEEDDMNDHIVRVSSAQEAWNTILRHPDMQLKPLSNSDARHWRVVRSLLNLDYSVPISLHPKSARDGLAVQFWKSSNLFSVPGPDLALIDLAVPSSDLAASRGSVEAATIVVGRLVWLASKKHPSTTSSSPIVVDWTQFQRCRPAAFAFVHDLDFIGLGVVERIVPEDPSWTYQIRTNLSEDQIAACCAIIAGRVPLPLALLHGRSALPTPGVAKPSEIVSSNEVTQKIN